MRQGRAGAVTVPGLARLVARARRLAFRGRRPGRASPASIRQAAWRGLEPLEQRLLLDADLPAFQAIEPLGSLIDTTAATGEVDAPQSVHLLAGPLHRLGPPAVLAHETTLTARIHTPTDVDQYAIELDPGQAIAVVVEPSDDLQVAAALRAPTGEAAGAVVAGAAGDPVYLAPFAEGGPGTWIITVSGVAGSGDYDLRVILNAAVEAETLGQAPNDVPADAQSIEEGFVSLGGSASEAVVRGQIGALAADGFETGTLGPHWTAWCSDPAGRVQVTDAYPAAGGHFALWMDKQPSPGYVLNEAVWTVDLSQVADATLRFRYTDEYDDDVAFNAPFAGHFNADGVAISADGVTWHPVFQPMRRYHFMEWFEHSVDLAAAAAAAGVALGPDFRIKFQHYHDRTLIHGGRGWDDIRIESSAVQDLADHYRFALTAGDGVELVLAGDRVDGLQLDLLDADGAVLAEARAREGGLLAASAARVDGPVYARVSGGNPGNGYGLVVNRNAVADLDAGSGPQQAKDMRSAGVAVGYLAGALGRLFAYDGQQRAIKELDPTSGAVLASVPWPLPRAGANVGMAATADSLLIGGAAGLLYEIDAATMLVRRVLDGHSVNPNVAYFARRARPTGQEFTNAQGSSTVGPDVTTG